MNGYSQAGQDIFILSLFDKDYNGTFVDIGCNMPNTINNTLLLEKNGWTGISIDIENFSKEWESRKTPFIQVDALKCNYKDLFKSYNLPKVIDYLNLDIEGEGLRYKALERVMKIGDFKAITIEHDLYRGYDLSERLPQRKLLSELGYLLLCSDVHVNNINYPFEDWWVNPKYLNESQYIHYKSVYKSGFEIIKENKI